MFAISPALSTGGRFKSTILTEGFKSIKSVGRLYPKSGAGSVDDEDMVLPRLSAYLDPTTCHIFPGEPMFSKKPLSRRSFIALAGATGAGVLAGCSKPDQSTGDADTTIEIVARQHGVLCRAVAILEEIRGGMDARMDLPPEIIGGTVEIIRLFIVESSSADGRKVHLSGF